MLTIVAAMAYGRPVFVAPADKREEARAAKLSLASAAPAAAKSDHIALVAAFNAWNQARLAGGWREAAEVHLHSGGYDGHTESRTVFLSPVRILSGKNFSGICMLGRFLIPSF